MWFRQSEREASTVLGRLGRPGPLALSIRPGWPIQPSRACGAHFGTDLLLTR